MPIADTLRKSYSNFSLAWATATTEAYYRDEYKTYAARLTDHLGGEQAYMAWYTRTLGANEQALTWEQRYYAAKEAVLEIERFKPGLHQQAVINVLNRA